MTVTESELVFACYSAACAPPQAGGSGGSLPGGKGGGGGGGSSSKSAVGRAASKASSSGSSGGGGAATIKLAKDGYSSYKGGDYTATKVTGGYKITGGGLTRGMKAKSIADATKKINAHNKRRDNPVTDAKAALVKSQGLAQVSAPTKFVQSNKGAVIQGRQTNINATWETPDGMYTIKKNSSGYRSTFNGRNASGTRGGNSGSAEVGRTSKTLKSAKASAQAHYKKYGSEINSSNKRTIDKDLVTIGLDKRNTIAARNTKKMANRAAGAKKAAATKALKNSSR